MLNKFYTSKLLFILAFLGTCAGFMQGAHAVPIAVNKYPSTVYPVDNHKALVNPGMGWMGYYFNGGVKYFAAGIDNKGALTKTCNADWSNCIISTDTSKFSKTAENYIANEIPAVSIIYMRLPWGELEPEENKFHWDIIDIQMDRWEHQGKKIALVIENSGTFDPDPVVYATPKWVFDKGAKCNRFDPKLRRLDINGSNCEPDFSDKIYLEKLRNFVTAFAKKYDGNPNIALIDMSAFGVYGECHTASSTKLSYTEDTVKENLDVYFDNFKKTPLVFDHMCADHERDMTPDKNGNLTGHVLKRDYDIVKYAREKGALFRDNSIMVDKRLSRIFYDQKMADDFYLTKPVILEPQNYIAPNPLPSPTTPLPFEAPSNSTPNGWWHPESLYDAVEAYHASYVGLDWYPTSSFFENPSSNWFAVSPLPNETANRTGLMGLVDKIAQRMGYRLQFTMVSWPKRILPDDPFTVQFSIRNNGVAPCYQGGFASIGFFDNKSTLVASGTETSFNVKDLPVGPIDTAALHSGSVAVKLPAGEYTVAVAMVDENGKPVYNLPYNKPSDMDHGDNYNVTEGYYPIGKVVINYGLDGSLQRP